MKTSRLAGLLYLVPTVLAPFSMMYVPSQVATAEQLVSREALFRAGMVSDLVVVLSEVAVTALLFVLFRHLGRTVALVAAGARFAMTVLQGANVMVSLVALQLRSAEWLQVHAQALHVWEVLFALHCVLLGSLVAKQSKVFGGLLTLAGLGYAVNGFGSLLVPSAAPTFASIVGVTAVVGEVPFVIWLLAGRGDLSPSPRGGEGRGEGKPEL